MAEEEEKDAKAKWASEAYAFLSLFRRLSKRLSGLLMLELGWSLLVKLVIPLAEEKGTTGATATAQAGHGVSAFSIFLIGGAVIAA